MADSALGYFCCSHHQKIIVGTLSDLSPWYQSDRMFFLFVREEDLVASVSPYLDQHWDLLLVSALPRFGFLRAAASSPSTRRPDE